MNESIVRETIQWLNIINVLIKLFQGLVTKADGTEITLNELKTGDMVQTPAGVEEIIGFMHDNTDWARAFIDISHELIQNLNGIVVLDLMSKKHENQIYRNDIVLK